MNKKTPPNSMLKLMMMFAILLSSHRHHCCHHGMARAVRHIPTLKRVAAFSSPNVPTEKKSCESRTEDDDGIANSRSSRSSSNGQVGVITPWNHPNLNERAQNSKHAFRSRQHVNPLSNKFQQPTVLSSTWPSDVYDDTSKPLFLDIGCSRGGFLLDIASQRPNDYNYLGLEIRPIVAHQAKQRVPKHNLQGKLDFVGCNVNVDLERLLTIADVQDKLQMVTIQFPDPHFKNRHAKRRVVTQELVTTLAKFMSPKNNGTIFLQSDIQPVLDDMRFQFRIQSNYFIDEVDNVNEYLPTNIFGIPTEREVGVLEKGLPVYRTTFRRSSVPFDEPADTQSLS